ncbi:MAG TPA: aminotransferase class III-fold pyridoxal phosphate-dependent enzyme [Planctomycetota bacterium]|nr:aminotransferase class III-fold pyridoxal phosphate-dependent enzyme [Planctomycetota bacterium]
MDYDDIVKLEERTELRAYAKLPLALVRGEGAYVWDARGDRYLDMYGGHAVCGTGHCHPRVVAAIREQAGKLIFYSNTVRSEVRARASERLLAHAPHPGSQVFYCNSGAEANETAMKLARKFTGREKIVTFQGSFHGRTVATLSACGIEHYRHGIAPLLAGHVHVPFGEPEALRAAVDRETAAVLMEPIQSIGGVTMASAGYYREAAQIAREKGALLLFDEVQTGLGRTGTFFFGEHFGVKPDVITLAKSIASGVPCGAVIVAPEVAKTVKTGDQGSTFGGGHIAMAAMLATLEAIDEEGLCHRAAQADARITAACRPLPGVKGIRGKGCLLGLELDRPAAKVQEALLERRVIAGTAGPSVLRLLPPMTIGAAEVDLFVAALADVLGAKVPA